MTVTEADDMLVGLQVEVCKVVVYDVLVASALLHVIAAGGRCVRDQSPVDGLKSVEELVKLFWLSSRVAGQCRGKQCFRGSPLLRGGKNVGDELGGSKKKKRESFCWRRGRGENAFKRTTPGLGRFGTPPLV